MRTSQTTGLSKPNGAERVPEGTLGYFRTRNRHRVYSLVIAEFQKSGLTQADLARRLGKGTDIVCRWLGSPGNWTLDTQSDLLFAISGAEAEYGIRYPLGTHNFGDASAVVRSTDSIAEKPPAETLSKIYRTDGVAQLKAA
jgi:hypothetical protein